MPALRTSLLSYQPVVVFSDTLQNILWSNAAGAQLFGGNGIVDLLAMDIPQSNPLVRQLHHAIGQMGEDNSIVRGFQINQGMHSQLLQFSIERIDGEGDEHAFKVTHLPGDDLEVPSEHDLAQYAVQSFEGLASAAAILDDNGLPIAQSGEFKTLSPTADNLEALVGELQAEDDRLIKRPARSSDGNVIIIGLARLGPGNKRNLIVIAEPHEDIPAEPHTHQQVPHPSSQSEENENRDDTQIEDDFSEAENNEAMVAPIDELADVDETASDGDTNTKNPASTYQSMVDAGTRFAWSIDENAVFTSVSDELTLLFGQSKSSLIGRSWQDVSKQYDLDPDGEIFSLLESRDTWSGKIVLWPLDDDGGEVAIELAALPAFDTNRVFSGFRGFGKVLHRVMAHDAKNRNDNLHRDEPGQTDGSKDGDEPEIAILLTPDDDKPSTEETSETVQAKLEASNILPFSRNEEPDQNLTAREQQALQAVRGHLSDTQLTVSDDEPIDPPDSVESAYQPNIGPDQPNSTILERLPVAVIVYRDETILYANRKFLETSGYGSIDALGKAGGLSELIGGELVEDGNTNTILHLANGETSVISPVLHSSPWGSEKAMLLSFVPNTNTIFQEADVLEINRAAEIQSILDTTNDGIILLESQGNILSINASAEALFGIEFNDAVGKKLEHLFAPESQTTISGYVANVMEDGVDQLINDGEEVIALEANGGIIPVFVTIAKMQSTGKLCVVLRDITNWKKTEEELIQSRKQAENSNEQKSEFLAKVSHEIRTPLNAIIGFSDVMIEERFGPIENDRYREYLRDIKRSGAHVLDIVNELLDLSRIEAGKLELTFEAVNLNEVVAETVALLQPEANTNRTIIRTSLSRSVPKIVADPRSIKQVILNLVSNAIKYSRTNSQVIVSTVYETNGEVALRVRDTGEGMTDEQIEKALQPFRQAHDLKDNTIQGSGLGLPLTKALVEANRAYFDLESEPGLGTIAHVQFPVQRVLGE